MVMPALAVPVIVLIRLSPDAVAEKTTKMRSPWLTGTLKELDEALLNPVPIAIEPFSAGVNFNVTAV